ncbi:related to nicotinamide mononucleotide permease [Phialocephala subalpina]|uniref:Related to nicotinamide mononucleotide permease n=1 Tax=Phialocephala subalpina TaxID=576137 RepID=A0A1L7X491_9HELO|nr:related to nicotinamide mononucleotide permease [Phialocephala subalpina]
MTSALDNFEKGLAHNDLDSASEGKGTNQHIDHVGKDEKGGVLEAGVSPQERRIFQAPELVRNMSPEEREYAEKRLRRKIDARLMPMIVLMYILNYLDRNNIAAAKLAGILTDLNLKGVEFQTSVSILFVGYLLMQVPSNLFLNKIGKPAIYLPACMVVWGIISAATAACQNYAGLIACRFMLGFVEAAYFPGCLYYLSCWYTRKELGFRTAIFYSGALISGAFSGLIAAGIKAHMDGAHGLRAWRWLFIIEGAITVVIAFASFFILPNFPRTTSWLTEEERQLATWRLEEDIGEDDWVDSKHQSFLVGAKLAFSDIKTYVLMFMLFGFVASGTVTNFFPTVVATLKYNSVNTLLLTAPPYVLAVITTFLNSWHADRTGERFFHIVCPLCFAVFAFILAACTTKIGPRYFAMMLMVPGVYTGYVVALAWISNSLPRPPAKRAAALAFINAISNTSSIYASYMYNADMAPRYVIAMSVNCAMAAMAIIAAVVLRFILVRLNRKLEQGIYVEGAINSGTTEAGKKGFRFRV